VLIIVYSRSRGLSTLLRASAFAGILTGGVTVFIWGKLLKGGLFDLYEIVPGFMLSLAAIVIASLLSKPPDTVEKLEKAGS
jgi:sodium/proline symporter